MGFCDLVSRYTLNERFELTTGAGIFWRIRRMKRDVTLMLQSLPKTGLDLPYYISHLD